MRTFVKLDPVGESAFARASCDGAGTSATGRSATEASCRRSTAVGADDIVAALYFSTALLAGEFLAQFGKGCLWLRCCAGRSPIAPLAPRSEGGDDAIGNPVRISRHRAFRLHRDNECLRTLDTDTAARIFERARIHPETAAGLLLRRSKVAITSGPALKPLGFSAAAKFGSRSSPYQRRLFEDRRIEALRLAVDKRQDVSVARFP